MALIIQPFHLKAVGARNRRQQPFQGLQSHRGRASAGGIGARGADDKCVLRRLHAGWLARAAPKRLPTETELKAKK